MGFGLLLFYFIFFAFSSVPFLSFALWPVRQQGKSQVVGPEVSRTTAGALLPRGLARGLRAEVGALSQVSGSSLSFPDGALPMVEGLQASLVAVQGPVGFPAPPWWCWMAASSVCVCACVIAPDPRRLTPQRIFLTVSGVLMSQQNSCLMSVRLVDLQGERVVSRLVSMSRHGQVIFPGGRSWWTQEGWRAHGGKVLELLRRTHGLLGVGHFVS